MNIRTKNLPDGDYTVVAWQETHENTDGKIVKPVQVTFKSNKK